MKNSTRRTVACALAAVAFAVVAVTVPSADQAAGVAGGRAGTLASGLCRNQTDSGPTLAIAGRGVQWAQPGSPSAAVEVTQLVLRSLREPGGTIIAANGHWVVVHEPSTRTTVRMRCDADERSVAHRAPFPVRLLSVSEQGDVASQAESGATSVEFASNWSERGSEARPQILDARPDGPAQMLWVDRNLWIFNPSRVTIVAPRGDGYSTTEIAKEDREPTVLVLSHNGLVYALSRGGCFDVFVGSAPDARLRRAACLPPGEGPDSGFVVMNQDAIRFLRPDGATVGEGPRIVALTGRVAGNVHEITSSVAALASADWIPSVPIPIMAGARDTREPRGPAGWDTVLKPQFWINKGVYQRAQADLAKKGWSDLRAQGAWSAGTGVAVRWQTGSNLVTPAGRSLETIGRETYYEETYSEQQLDGILNGNANLNRSLEGRLFQTDWIPIGAALKASAQGPYGFVTLKSLGTSAPWRSAETASRPVPNILRALTQTKALAGACDPSPAEPAGAMGEIVQNGISLIGRTEGTVGGEFTASSRVQVIGSGAFVLTCRVASAPAVRLLVVRRARLAAIGVPVSQRAEVAQHPLTSAQYSRGTDANWPVAAEEDLVVGIGTQPPMTPSDRAVLLRWWLDDVLESGRVDRVLLPVSYLELMLAADSRWRERATTIPNVTLVSNERIPAKARGVDCSTPALLAARQMRYEELVALKSIARPARVVQSVVGVVENAVDVLRPMFMRGNGESAWVELSQQFFKPISGPPPGMSPVNEHITHGTQVSGLIYSTVLPTGLLSDVRLTWVNAAGPSEDLLNVLAGRNGVLNVSQQLLAWRDLRKKPYVQQVLFVAAAHNNIGEDDGAPLEWKLPNTIGVGATTDSGVTPKPILDGYDAGAVDLLAPGDFVPAPGGQTGGECVNGTSFAAAYVSAVAALVQQQATGPMDPPRLRARLMATATWQPEYWGHVKGGLIHAARAFNDLGRNVLIVPAADGTDLELIVRVDEKPVTVTGEEFGVPPKTSTRTLTWTQILRLTKSGQDTDPATGQSRTLFHMVFVDNEKYTVWENARFSAAESMPLSNCEKRDQAPVTCGAQDLRRIRDYVAQSTRLIVSAF